MDSHGHSHAESQPLIDHSHDHHHHHHYSPPSPPPHHRPDHPPPPHHHDSSDLPPAYQTIETSQSQPDTRLLVIYASPSVPRQQSPQYFFVRFVFGVLWLSFAIWILSNIITLPGHSPSHQQPGYPQPGYPHRGPFLVPGHRHHGHYDEHFNGIDKLSSQCAQPSALLPSHDNEQLSHAWEYLSSPKFANASVQRLQGAVRIRTPSFDDLGEVGEDPRYDVFYPFAAYLKTTYPSIHEKLQLEKVNTHGLFYTWKGSDDSLKPSLLMAHQDVVPVPDNTLSSWTYPPFDAVFDGTFIWGRGANDCKNQLTAIMDSIELLINAGFEPKRTLLLSFGFDEESKGTEGAGRLAPFILERYGKDGLEMIVDEGEGYVEAFGQGFAAPAVAEKGYLDVDITVRSPGGHSSIPRDHTSIGILSELITKIEASPYETFLAPSNPYLSFLQCASEHAPDFPKHLRKLVKSHGKSSDKSHDKLAQEAARIGGLPIRYLMQTSQAVDIITGGGKVNALPESATVTINHRINIGEDPSFVREHLSKIAEPIAKAYNLSLSAWEGDLSPQAETISLRSRKTELRVAPVTPTDFSSSGKNTPYKVLGGTIRAVFGDESPVVAPGLSTGNTDTKSYWDLTRHIFRFDPGTIGEHDGMGNIHTVDERVSAANHIKAVKWFTMFIRNVDEAEIDQ